MLKRTAILIKQRFSTDDCSENKTAKDLSFSGSVQMLLTTIYTKFQVYIFYQEPPLSWMMSNHVTNFNPKGSFTYNVINFSDFLPPPPP